MRRSLPDAPTDTSPKAVAPDSVAPPGAKPAEPSVVEFASELEPSATEFAVDAVVAPPIATLSLPDADESPSVELAWKYLMPSPLMMLLPKFCTRLFRYVTLFETLLTLPSSA